MKHFVCFLLAIIFVTAASYACDPIKECAKTNDTAAAKKAPVKLPAVTVQPVKKQTSKKEEKKTESDFASPLSWKPTLLY